MNRKKLRIESHLRRFESKIYHNNCCLEVLYSVVKYAKDSNQEISSKSVQEMIEEFDASNAGILNKARILK